MRTVRTGPGLLLSGLVGLVALVALLLTLSGLPLQAAPPRGHLPAGRAVPPSPVPFQVGDVLASSGGSGVRHYRPDGTFVRELNTLSDSFYQMGLCFDAPGRLYTANWSAGTMTQFDPLGQVLTFPWGGPFDTPAESCVADAAGNIYVGQSSGVNRIRKFTPSGKLLATYAPQIGGAERIELAADQCTIYYTAQSFEIMRFNVCTNTQLPNLTTLGTQNYSLRLRPNGELLVGTTIGAYRLSPAGTILQIYWNSAYDETGVWWALTLDPDGTTFWAAGYNARGRVHRINIASGVEQSYFDVRPLSAVLGLAIAGEAGVGQQTATPTATPVPTGTPLPPTATIRPPTGTPTRATTPTRPPGTPSLTPTSTPPPPGTVCATQTPTRVPTPPYTPAPGCAPAPERGDLQAIITDHPTTTEALFTNRSTTCSYRIGLAAYEKPDGWIDHQELYDYTLAIIPPRSTLVLTVNNPPCAYQADAFWGELIESFAGGVRYNERRLDDTDGHGHQYCPSHCSRTPTPPLLPTSTPTPRRPANS
jgi:hypothetical protein